MKNEIRDILPRILMLGFRIFRIDQKKAVFKSFRGIDCGDNPRAIYDEMHRQRPDYKYIWITQNMDKPVLGADLFVKYMNLQLHDCGSITREKAVGHQREKGSFIFRHGTEGYA